MEKKSKLIFYLVLSLIIIFVLVITIMLLGGYIKDATTKKGCKLTDKIYVEGNKPGMAVCIEK